jgi:MerR family transcriptional regulator/heat shock protein HspR
MQEEKWRHAEIGVRVQRSTVAERQELGVYAISVVAQLVGTGQQNIRLYERKGLLTPDRTAGGTRQYSNADLAVLRRISELLEEGLNLAGVAKVLELEAVNARLQSELNRLRSRRS